MDLKFVVDHMLGRLAKWLRILGFDTLYFRDTPDDALVEAALNENRILLTRDGPLSKRLPLKSCVFIHHQRYHDQIKEILDVLNIQPDETQIFSRCTNCNSPLRTIEKEAVRTKVPPGVFEHQETYWHCEKCDKVYWKGTHFEKSVGILKEDAQTKGDRRRF